MVRVPPLLTLLAATPSPAAAHLLQGFEQSEIDWRYATLAAGVVLALIVGLYLLRLGRRLKTSEGYRAAFERAPVGMVMFDQGMKIRDWNRHAEKIFGWSRDEVLGRSMLITVPEDTESAMPDALTRTRDQGDMTRLISWSQGCGDRRVLCEWVNARMPGIAGEDPLLLSVALDVTEHKALERVLLENEQKYWLVAENASDVIWTLDLEGRFTYVSPSVERLRGYEPAEVLKQSLDETVAPGSLPQIRATVDPMLAGRDSARRRLEVEQIRRDGATVWTEVMVSPMRDWDGRLTGLIGISRDITERRVLESRLSEMALKDMLTGLANRTLFFDRLHKAMAHSDRTGTPLAVLYIDLDGFKAVNDAYGHATGDRVLQRVARRVAAAVRGSDTVARIGGDEFTVIVTDLTDPQDAAGVARKVLRELRTPVDADGGTHEVGASIGISIYPKDGADPEQIVSRADAAMYSVKGERPEKLAFYTPAR